MNKENWFQASKDERTELMKSLLQQIIEIDKSETVHCKRGTRCKTSPAKFNLEQKVLVIIAWEREENQED